jgi:hypothetical protein
VSEFRGCVCIAVVLIAMVGRPCMDMLVSVTCVSVFAVRKLCVNGCTEEALQCFHI